jgi:hypothetical protein
MAFLTWLLGGKRHTSKPTSPQDLASAQESLHRQYALDVKRGEKRRAQAQEQLDVVNKRLATVRGEISEYDDYLEWRLKVFQNALGRLDETKLRMQYHRDVDALKGRRLGAVALRSDLEEKRKEILEEIQDWDRILTEGLKKKLDADLEALANAEAARLSKIRAIEQETADRAAALAEQKAADEAEIARKAAEATRAAEEFARMSEEQVGFEQWRTMKKKG